MKKYLLDTDICIHFLKGEYELDQQVKSVGLNNCFLSEITILELTYGVENSDSNYKTGHEKALQNLKQKFQERIIPINSCFSTYAQEKVRLRRAGTPIGEFDLLIGCSAIANSLVIVTNKARGKNKVFNYGAVIFVPGKARRMRIAKAT